MRNLKKKFQFRIHLKSKHLLVIMTFFCGSAVVSTLASGVTSEPLAEAAGMIVVPFEKSINGIGSWIGEINQTFQDKQDLIDKNQELQDAVDTLTEQNNILIQNQSELSRLQELYNLDEEYSSYPKVAARIISKDPGNWYDTFMINRGSNDGIRVDNNVIAGKGLVGIVTEVGPNWATVRAIIDDSSNVSATVTSISQNCMVTGDLQMMDDGKIRFIQLTDKEDQVQEGDKIVTSSVSNKFLKGILIGYISEVSTDANKLTKSGTIIPAVDFNDIQEVLVIKELKQQKTEDVTSEESQTPDDSTTPTPDPTQDAQEDEQ
jgi:rod shape-determining protein MreC